MNARSNPWSPANGGGSSGDYVNAYRHVHDLFVAAGAKNVSWVWSPVIVQGTPTPLASVYPGSRYVDVVGVDGYNAGTDLPAWGGWQTPARLFGPTLKELATVARGKPVWINETGSTEHGGSKAAWITELFAYLEQQPEVTGLVLV